MTCEIPVLNRCCFCLPLRKGLLVWVYLKQIFSIVAIVLACLKMFVESRLSPGDWIFYPLSIVILLTDILFHVLFIIGAHKKDYKKIRIFYRYNLVHLCLFTALIVIFLCYSIYAIFYVPWHILFFMYITLPLLGICLIILVMESYLIVLVRSEFLKLKNNSQFEFVNKATEAECSMKIDLTN